MIDPLLIEPIRVPLNASVRVPGSKSLTNRLLLLAALADETTILDNALFSDDSARFAESLQRLGFRVEMNESVSRIEIEGLGGKIPNSQADLDVGNAGTAARFLTAMLSLGNGEYTLDGDPRMRERPIGDLVSALGQLGATIIPMAEQSGTICPPLKIYANGLQGGMAAIAGNISSQYLSGLLMVAPYARNPVTLEVIGELNSKPYVDMTLAVMGAFGIAVQRSGYEQFEIQSQIYHSPGHCQVESDASAASYFFAAPAICGGEVRVENINRQSKQGDIAFLDVLQKMGCKIFETGNAISVRGPEHGLQGLDVDMRDISDMAQTLAAIAPFASTPTRIRGIASSRLKETDRITAVCAELAKLGVTVEEFEDGMLIYPCNELHPATIDTYNDHRMAMAFSLVGLRSSGVKIANPGCVSKTFPAFFDVLDLLRGGN